MRMVVFTLEPFGGREQNLRANLCNVIEVRSYATAWNDPDQHSTWMRYKLVVAWV
jgi:hypothetical protein